MVDSSQLKILIEKAAELSSRILQKRSNKSEKTNATDNDNHLKRATWKRIL